MPEYLSPWVFRSEVKASDGSVSNASTSTYATVAWLPKGPENTPVLVTSFARFVDMFGGYTRRSYVPFVLASFFQNTGPRAYIVRVTPSDATKAVNTSGLADVATAARFVGRTIGSTLDLSAKSKVAIRGTTGVAITVDCVGATPASTTRSEILTALNTAITTCTFTVENNCLVVVGKTAGNTSVIEFSAAADHDASDVIFGLDVTDGKTYLFNGESASDWSLQAKWNGAWYNQVRCCISGNPDYEDGHGGYTRYNLAVAYESEVGKADWGTVENYDAVSLDDDESDFFVTEVVNPKTNHLTITNGTTFAAPRSLRASRVLSEWMGEGNAALQTFTGTLKGAPLKDGSLVVNAGAIIGTDNGDNQLSGTGVTSGTIDYETGAFSITFAVAPASGVQIYASYYKVPSATSVCVQLATGSDGVGPLTRGDVTDPVLEATKKGLYALNSLEEIMNVSIPDFAGNIAVSNDLIAYGENWGNRFILLTSPIATTPQNVVKFVRNTAAYNTSYGAFYYPWVKVYDPIANDGRTVTIPPDGFVAGVYARTDANRNVGKAPAGVNDGKLIGALGLEVNLDKGERDLVFPARINPIISTTQTGFAVFGASTLSKDAEWKNVNARRLFMFCEQSIYDASFWICFENNGPGLWSRMASQGRGFFLPLFNDGYFAGKNPSEGFAIVIDESNNDTSSVKSGFVTADYYIAPNEPAVFVRLRFRQMVKK